jgi:uncharacterized protein (TIGR00369 family)
MEKMKSPYENFLEMYLIEKRQGFAKVGLTYRKELTNPHGNFHGGVIASLVDTASVQALRTLFSAGPYFTADMKIRYKNPSTSREIFAEANSKPLKGKFFVTSVVVFDKENVPVAQAEVKSFLPNG